MAIHQLSDDAESTHESPAQHCFIAADPRTNIEPIRALLTARGIRSTASYERPWLGARPLDTVMALIDDADIVVAVLDDVARSANTIFEVGFAFARDKKILVVIPRGSESVPSILASTLYVRADTKDTDAIGFNLDQLLAAPQPKRKPHLPSTHQTHAIGAEADQLLVRLDTAMREMNPLGLESVTIDALKLSGVRIVQSVGEFGLPRSGPDLGIWCDDLESSVGNPLLIELKMNIPHPRAWQSVRQQVVLDILDRSADWALVLYGEGSPQWGGTTESEAPVLVLGIRTLLERLRTEGFAEIVSSLRDQAITAV